MAKTLRNVSFDGSPVRFLMDSPLLACFDPIALDKLHDFLPKCARVDVVELLEQTNANYPAVACYTIPNFRPGLFMLDPRDIKKFGDEEEDFDYSEGEQTVSESGGSPPAFLFVAVDSGTLIFADVACLPKLVTLLTWEEYDRSLEDDYVLPRIVEELGGPHFALIVADSRLGIPFDGDGIYTIAHDRIKQVRD